MLYRKNCSYKFCNIYRKTPVLEFFFDKALGLQAYNFIKKRIQHWCFPVNVAEFLRTPFTKKICERLLPVYQVTIYDLALTRCEEDQQIASEPTSFDMFKPECNSDGSYKSIQCYQHKQYGKWCWCVDKKGQEIIGSKVDDSQNKGNLTEAKCRSFGTANSNNDYWTAFYRTSTTVPSTTLGTTAKPILVVSQIDGSMLKTSSHLEVFCKKMFLKISQSSQENTCTRDSLLKKRPWRNCFPVNFAKLLKTTFCQNTFG